MLAYKFNVIRTLHKFFERPAELLPRKETLVSKKCKFCTHSPLVFGAPVKGGADSVHDKGIVVTPAIQGLEPGG